MSFVKVSEVLSAVAKKSGDPVALESTVVLGVIENSFVNLFSEKAVGNIFVKSFNKGELICGVSSSVWASEIKMKEEQIKENINKKLKNILVEKIKTRVMCGN